MIIAVIGNYDPPPHVYALAEGVGKELARRGITLVCGGLTGVMEAVCKGSKSENGTTIGILPGGSPRTANEYVDFPVATNMGFARNVAVVSTGQAVIAGGGAFGTLSEIAYALSYGIPVVSLHSWPLTLRGDGLPVPLPHRRTLRTQVAGHHVQPGLLGVGAHLRQPHGHRRSD